MSNSTESNSTVASERPASGGSPSQSPRALLSFAAIGAIGFLIEATILTALTHFAAWTPWQARMPSFLTAVLATWALNRRHTFAHHVWRHRWLEALGYIFIQSGGAAINLMIFGACLTLAPALEKIPVIALAAGSAGGFAFNFISSSRLLYARAPVTGNNGG